MPFFLICFNMKKNTSIRIETESSDVDGDSCEEESVSTSDSIIEQLKNALKKKKALKRKQKHLEGDTKMNQKKKLKEEVSFTIDIDHEEEDDVDTEETIPEVKNKPKAPVSKISPRVPQRKIQNNVNKRQGLMDEQDDNVESETPVLKRSPRVTQRHTVNNVSNSQGAMVKEDDDEAEINEEENQVVKKNTKAITTTKYSKPIQGKTPSVNIKRHDLLERYTKIAAKNKTLGKKNSWYTLKFHVLKECSAANYHVVEMELSNEEEPEKLNIWLKASFIQDCLKCMAENDAESSHLFNGFENVYIESGIAELRDKPYGEDGCRSNKKDSFVYKDYVNYFLIPKEMGSHHDVIEQFTETTVNILKSEEFFYMMTIYQNGRNNSGGAPGNVLRDADAELWKQLKAENNFVIRYMRSLNARFCDNDINNILHYLFQENSIEARYQKFGWDDIKMNPWKKGKK